MSPDGSPVYVWEYHKTARTTLARYKQGLGLNSIGPILLCDYSKKKKRNGRHEETRTPDLYRVKVAL